MHFRKSVRQVRPIQEKRYTKLKTLVEGSTEAAKEMVFVLVDAAGGDSGKKQYKNLEPFAIKNGFNSSLDLGKKITDTIGLTGKGGYMAPTGTLTK